MYVDRYRFPSGNPDKRCPLPKLRAWPDILAAHNAFADRESRRLFRALLIYRYVGPYASAVTHNREIATALESFMGIGGHGQKSRNGECRLPGKF